MMSTFMRSCSRLCSYHKSSWFPQGQRQQSYRAGSAGTRNRFLAGQPVREISFWPTSKRNEAQKPKSGGWKTAISEAESVVGYTTSFMSLRCLLSDELSNIAMQMRRLVGTGHPLLDTARQFLYDGKHSLQTRGLIVLLVSKAAGPVEQNGVEMNESMTSGIYPKQRSVAEITEMIHTANLIHKSVVNLSSSPQSATCQLGDMQFGNNIAVLSGDYLLANIAMALAELDNTHVVELMSSAIGDLVEAEFSLPASDGRTSTADHPTDHATVDATDDATDHATDHASDHATDHATDHASDHASDHATDQRQRVLAEWQQYTLLGTANLIAKSCQSALMLAGHSVELQRQAFLFGKHMAFARKLHDELLPFANPSDFTDRISSCSLPVLLYRCEAGGTTLTTEPTAELTMAQSQQMQTALCDSDIVMEVRQMCQRHGTEALAALDHFESSDSTQTLTKMVRAMTTL